MRSNLSDKKSYAELSSEYRDGKIPSYSDALAYGDFYVVDEGDGGAFLQIMGLEGCWRSCVRNARKMTPEESAAEVALIHGMLGTQDEILRKKLSPEAIEKLNERGHARA